MLDGWFGAQAPSDNPPPFLIFFVCQRWGMSDELFKTPPLRMYASSRPKKSVNTATILRESYLRKQAGRFDAREIRIM